MKTYTEADMEAARAEAWQSGYWYGTCHEGPVTDAAVRAKNPHIPSGLTPAKVAKVALKTDRDRGASTKSATVSETDPHQEGDL